MPRLLRPPLLRRAALGGLLLGAAAAGVGAVRGVEGGQAALRLRPHVEVGEAGAARELRFSLSLRLELRVRAAAPADTARSAGRRARGRRVS